MAKSMLKWGIMKKSGKSVILAKKKVVTASSLRKKLDKVFSLYIRKRDNYTCFTCGKRLESRFAQCGHFVPRQYLATRYSEINCHCQCYACNVLYGGQPSAYATRLKEKYGGGIVENLESRRQQVIKDFPYQELIEKYTKLLTVD